MTESATDYRDRIICGDAFSTLRDLPDSTFECIVTSPPYFRQRDYGHSQQVGQEEATELYVERLARVFDECRRVLSPTGTLWLNLGDKYLDGHLQGLPWQVALELKKRGWVLRSEIIWQKSNAMPHPVTTRPTTAHEHVFLFAKSTSYYYDADAIREPHKTFSKDSKMRGGRGHFGVRGGTPENGKYGGDSNLHDGRWDQAFHPEGRNKRTVWEIPLGKFPEAHFAVFPEALVEPCILAGCPTGGTVLDPFLGAGTVAVVSRRLSRHFCGIELIPDFVEMARKRIQSIQPSFV